MASVGFGMMNPKKSTSYIFEENMKFFVLLWVNSGLKERKEYVLQHLGKIRYQLLRLEYVTEKQKKHTYLGNL